MTLAKHIKNNEQLPLVVIVGRTNVGKSTLFNTLVGHRRALVSNIAGTTRDVNLSEVEWQGKSFRLADLGGFMDLKYLFNKKQVAATIDQAVQKQAREFLTRADLVLFVADVKEGLTADDQSIARGIKRLQLAGKTIAVVNKVDGERLRSEAGAFYKLGLGEPQLISAATGSGTGDLLDMVIDKIQTTNSKQQTTEKASSDTIIQKTEKAIKICILGKPNVGKSSLLNALLGYERVIVSPLEHTTREPQNTELDYRDRHFVIVDTAGIHKQGLKTGPAKARDVKMKRLENQGIAMSLDTLRSSDMVFLVLDVNEGLTKQDVKLAEKAIELKKSLVLVANKWDLVEKRDTKAFTQSLYGKIPFAQFAPIQFLSAKTKEKVHHLLDLALEIDQNRRLLVSDAELKSFIAYCVSRHLPTKGKGFKFPKVRYFRQTGTNPPEFAVRIGAREHLADSYLHFLQNRLRERYNLNGTPVVVWVEKSAPVHGKAGQ